MYIRPVFTLVGLAILAGVAPSLISVVKRPIDVPIWLAIIVFGPGIALPSDSSSWLGALARICRSRLLPIRPFPSEDSVMIRS